MSNLKQEKFLYSGLIWILFVALVLGGLSFSLFSSEEAEDLIDNEICLDCHLDEEHLGSIEVQGQQVHNPHDGSLKVEAHKEFACIDCHLDIEEIPHKEDVERTVNCMDCHEEPPQ